MEILVEVVVGDGVSRGRDVSVGRPSVSAASWVDVAARVSGREPESE